MNKNRMDLRDDVNCRTGEGKVTMVETTKEKMERPV